MHLGGVARGAGGAERSSRGREGEKFLFSRVLRANPVAQAGSLFPLKLTAYLIQSDRKKKKKKKKKKRGKRERKKKKKKKKKKEN